MKSLLIIFFILYLDLIAFTIILPLFPSIIDHYSEHDASNTMLKYIYDALNFLRDVLNMPDRRRYNNVLVAGMLGSLFSFLQFLSSPIIGACSDVFGRKKLLIVSMIGTCVAYTLWWRAETFTLFVISRIIAGLTKGSVTVCTTIVSDICKKEDAGKGMAHIGLAFSFGFISGPLIGAYFASGNHHLVTPGNHQVTPIFAPAAQVAIIFQLISIVLTMMFLEETRPLEHINTKSSFYSKVLRLTNPFQLFTFSSSQNKKATISLRKLVLIYFIFLVLFSGLEFTLPFLTHERFNFTGMQQGKLLFVGGLIMMLVQGGYVRRMKHQSEKKISLQGLLMLIPAMLLFSISSSVTMTYLAITFYSFGAATVTPCLSSLFTQQSEKCDAGENVGVLRSAGALARAVAPVLSCSIYWGFGSTICYVTGGVLFIVPWLMLKKIDTITKTDGGKKE